MNKLKLLARVLAILWAEDRGESVWTFNSEETCSDCVIVVNVRAVSRELKSVEGETRIYAS